MATYQAACEWIIRNDDVSIFENEPAISTTMALVMNLWGKDKEEIITDLRKTAQRLAQNE